MSFDFCFNLTILINERFCSAQGYYESQINEIKLWLNEIINQTDLQSIIKKTFCQICESKEYTNNLEGHHIAGRKHDFRQITACKKCHRWLSDRQKTWDKRWLDNNVSEDFKMAFFLLGLQDVLILKSKKTGNSFYENLAYSFTENISELLKRG